MLARNFSAPNAPWKTKNRQRKILHSAYATFRMTDRFLIRFIFIALVLWDILRIDKKLATAPV